MFITLVTLADYGESRCDCRSERHCMD
jgi:hypothetical protein